MNERQEIVTDFLESDLMTLKDTSCEATIDNTAVMISTPKKKTRTGFGNRMNISKVINEDPEGLNAGFKCSIFSREIPSALFKIDNVFGCFGEDGRLGKFVSWDVRVTHERCNEEKQISKSRTARGWDMIVKKYLIKLRWHLYILKIPI